MSFVSITRLRLRSPFLLLPFMWHAMRSSNQIQKAQGFIKGKTLMEAKLTFWTMSIWNDELAMRAYRNTEAHKLAMPKLQFWCDEASVVHWELEDEIFPGWPQAHERMVKLGRLSKVKRPSLTHSLHQIATPHYPSKTERILLPKK